MKRNSKSPREITFASTTVGAGTSLRRRTPILGIVGSTLVFVAGMMVAGCGKEGKVEELKPEDVAPVKADATPEEQQNQRMKMAVAMRDGIMPPEPELQLKGGEQATPEVLEAYNQLLLRAMVARREPPTSLQELQRWPLPRLPSPPPGKRIIYDPANCIVRLDPP